MPASHPATPLDPLRAPGLPAPPDARAARLAVLALGVGLLQGAGMTGFGQLALVAGGAGKTAVLVYTMPFWMILLAVPLLGEKPRLPHYVAAAIAALGLLLVIEPGHWHGSLASSLLALAAGASWAGGSVVAKLAFRHHRVDLLGLTAWQMAVGAAVLSVLALATHQQPVIWSSYMLLALGYNAVLATALGWVLWLFIVRALPAGIAGLSSLMIPIMSVLLALWLLGEKPSLAESGGIVLIMLALALALLAGGGTLRAGLRRLASECEERFNFLEFFLADTLDLPELIDGFEFAAEFISFFDDGGRGLVADTGQLGKLAGGRRVQVDHLGGFVSQASLIGHRFGGFRQSGGFGGQGGMRREGESEHQAGGEQ